MAVDSLDTALRVCLVDFLCRIEERKDLFDGTDRSPNHSDIYDLTMSKVKALCRGLLDPEEYLAQEALSS